MPHAVVNGNVALPHHIEYSLSLAALSISIAPFSLHTSTPVITSHSKQQNTLPKRKTVPFRIVRKMKIIYAVIVTIALPLLVTTEKYQGK